MSDTAVYQLALDAGYTKTQIWWQVFKIARAVRRKRRDQKLALYRMGMKPTPTDLQRRPTRYFSSYGNRNEQLRCRAFYFKERA